MAHLPRYPTALRHMPCPSIPLSPCPSHSFSQEASSCFVPLSISCCSVTQSRQTPCDPMDCSMPGFPVLHCLPEFAKLTSIGSMMPSNHLIFCHPLLLLPSIFPSIKVFSNELALDIRWPKYWNFSFSISPSNEYLGLISFRIDWFDLLSGQGTLKSLLQDHSSKASIFRQSAFFSVQFSHPYMTTGKTIALIIWTLVVNLLLILYLFNYFFSHTAKYVELQFPDQGSNKCSCIGSSES